jgi:hypothetical protein
MRIPMHPDERARLQRDIADAQERRQHELTEAAIYARIGAAVLPLRERAYDNPKDAPALAALAQLEMALGEIEIEERRRSRWADQAGAEERAAREELDADGRTDDAIGDDAGDDEATSAEPADRVG